MSISPTQSDLYPPPGQVSQNAAGSTFAEVDNQERIIPAIEFRDVYWPLTITSFSTRSVLR
jgi:hypothetical protein